MNILPMRVSVTSVTQIEVGEYYHVRGTDAATGKPIPPQFIKVKTPPIVNNLSLGMPTMRCDLWIKVDDMVPIILEDVSFDVWTVNIKPGKGITTGHGHHDRELVRITNLKQLEEIMGSNDYSAVMAEATPKMGVVDAYGRKYGSYR